MITTKRKNASTTPPPRVQRVVEELERRINQGRLRAGDQLPTLRELCRAFDVSYGVIHQALQHLEHEGLVHKLHGSGTYVKERRPSKAANSADGATRLPRPQRSDVFILMHAIRADFSTPLSSLVCAIQDRGLIPIPVAFDRFQPEAVERLLSLWHESPPRAVLVRGSTRLVAETVQKHSPAVTRFVVIYGLSDGTDPHWHCVHPDEFAAYRLAARHLIEQGHRRIGLPITRHENMTPELLQSFLMHKQAGIRQAFADAKLPDGLVFFDKIAPHNDASAMGLTTENVLGMSKWLKSEKRPTGIVENAYRMPVVLAAAREAGMRIGSKDLSVVGIGDPTPATQGEYPCVSAQFDEISRQTMAMVMSDDEDFDNVGRQVVVPPVFVSQWQPNKSKHSSPITAEVNA